ncbi:hypothetical protein NBRC116599_42280 [Aquicoccus sp. SU-CL01552]
MEFAPSGETLVPVQAGEKGMWNQGAPDGVSWSTSAAPATVNGKGRSMPLAAKAGKAERSLGPMP